MSDTTFTPFVSGIPASWLNDINIAVYRAIGSQAAGVYSAPTTPAQVLANIGGLAGVNLLSTSVAGGFGVDLVGGAGRVVSSIAGLRSLLKTGVPSAFVTGYYLPGDGGGGSYSLVPLDTTSADNGGTIIVATDGGRWYLNYNGEVSIKQFGCKGDGVTNDTTALQAAVSWAYGVSTALPAHSLYAPTGTYLNSGITATYSAGNSIGLNIRGDGLSSTTFQFTTSTGLVIAGPSGAVFGNEISGINFTGISSTVLVELRGGCGQRLRRCRFGTGLEGLRFSNYAPGTFTEYCQADTCVWDTLCTTKMRYTVVSGNNSFNGTGMIGANTINSTSAGGDNIVQVDNGCLVYNAPLNAQIWANNSCTVVNNANSGNLLFCFFHGALTLERFAGTITLGASAAGYEIPFAGTILSLNEYWKYGNLYQCVAASDTTSGTIVVKGARWSGTQTIATGANAIPTPLALNGAKLTYCIKLVGTSYTKSWVVDGWGTFVTTGGAPAVRDTFQSFDGIGYAAVTFSYNGSNQLVVTFPSAPSGTITMYVDVVQEGFNQNYSFIGA